MLWLDSDYPTTKDLSSLELRILMKTLESRT